jgi:hypothetical protein
MRQVGPTVSVVVEFTWVVVASVVVRFSNRVAVTICGLTVVRPVVGGAVIVKLFSTVEVETTNMVAGRGVSMGYTRNRFIMTYNSMPRPAPWCPLR